MNSLLGFSLLFFVVHFATISAQSPATEQFQFKGTLDIVPRNTKNLYNGFGAMKSVRQCGGQGKFLEWRRETCEQTIQGPCVHPPNIYTRGELSFTPLESSDALGIRGKLLNVYGEELSGYDIPSLPNSAVKGGQEFSVLSGLSLKEELRGQFVTGRVELYRPSDKKVELCAESDLWIL